MPKLKIIPPCRPEKEAKTIGKAIEISMSKIKNWTAIKKKRTEKGLRKNSRASNPHSKGELFSRSLLFVNLRNKPRK